MELAEESQTTDSDPNGAPINLDALDRELAFRGWDYADLSKATGLHRTTLARMRKDGGHCRSQTKSKIARALVEQPRVSDEILEVLGVQL